MWGAGWVVREDDFVWRRGVLVVIGCRDWVVGEEVGVV